MNFSKPAGVSPSALSQIDHAQAHGAAAASAAAAADVSKAHHVPLQALGFGSAAVSARPVHFVGVPDNHSFVAALDDDTLGITAGYLSQSDQLLMRQVDPSVRAVVDPIIHTLKVSAREACTLLSQPNRFSKLRELRLSDFRFTDPDLTDLARVLATMPKTDFELIVGTNSIGYGSTDIVDGVKALAALRLSGLTLNGISISNDTSRALALSGTPISIHLPNVVDGHDDLYEIVQIPMLRSLRAGYVSDLSADAINALRSHEALEHFDIDDISGEHLAILATSANIRSLAIEFITRGAQAAALSALATNRVLTSLEIGVDNGNAFAALSQSMTLQKLRMHVHELAPSSLASIATMPALKEFHLSVNDEREASIGGNDIAALCAKQLTSLSFCNIKMDGPARLHLATAKTTELRLEGCTPFASEAFAVLNQNQSIKRLFMSSLALFTSNENILSLVTSGMPQLESLDVTVKGWGAVQGIKTAWVNSGRQAGNLNLRIVA